MNRLIIEVPSEKRIFFRIDENKLFTWMNFADTSNAINLIAIIFKCIWPRDFLEEGARFLFTIKFRDLEVFAYRPK